MAVAQDPSQVSSLSHSRAAFVQAVIRSHSCVTYRLEEHNIVTNNPDQLTNYIVQTTTTNTQTLAQLFVQEVRHIDKTGTNLFIYFFFIISRYSLTALLRRNSSGTL